MLTTGAIGSSLGKKNIDKDMLNFYVVKFSNIEYRKDGKTALISNERNGSFQMLDIASKTMLGSPYIIKDDFPAGWQMDVDRLDRVR